ncbi:hypothetical protein EV651_10947 [Kribbella sp. VKM Ac-2571]|uniref:hypothetical protein n=1 Tax=Kribbella sp. VKM Ac-2571 TaxID=2512222 RepID=UPI00105C87C3|nr:hypothetical protein [Kribbella sp. VKM Ac-2571]TDO58772.1 hypothetical protein EV651_10947 [Kribbella sp. VKM Ac-2571]
MLTDQLSTEALGVLLHAADAAGPHLARPWRLEVDGHLIDVHLDAATALPEPIARAERIATGAALFNVRCAAASLSLQTWFSLYPYPQNRSLAARIVIEPTGLPDEELRKLYRAILSRHLLRPPSGPDVAARFALERAAELENAHVQWLPAGVRSLGLITTDLDQPADQIHLGMARQRVLLTALSHDVRTTCLNHTLIRFGESPAEADAREQRSDAS